MEKLIESLDTNYRYRQILQREAIRALKGKEILFPFTFMQSPRRRSRRIGVVRDVVIDNDKFLLKVKVYRLDGTGKLANPVMAYYDDVEVIDNDK